MKKQRTVFVCQQCGNESLKWLGRCPACGEWNSLVETRLERESQRRGGKERKGPLLKPQKLSEIKVTKTQRIKTGYKELDRVLGEGIVSGSVVLVAGEPGIGKSTLLLQLAAKAGGRAVKGSAPSVLYVSGEESLAQIKLRADRLGVRSSRVAFLAETDVDVITEQMESTGLVESGKERAAGICFNCVIVDSIQTLTADELAGAAGSVGQVRECAQRLLQVGKRKGLPIFLVGHVTKEGNIAGPKVLEHMVDTVLYLEGERYGNTRLLRTTKNRFGATDEVGIFEMRDKGLVEVDNPSELFLAERQEKSPGSVVTAAMEGTRPLLIEVQALTVSSQLAIPRRVGRGVDYNRLQLIVAVLTKQLGLPLGSHDIFVNVAGGMKVEEPAADLAVALAIISSFKNVVLGAKTVAFGELGLLGELRRVSQAERRIKEAKRLGFTRIVSPERLSSIREAAKSF